MKKQTFFIALSGLAVTVLFIWLSSYFGVFETLHEKSTDTGKQLVKPDAVSTPSLNKDFALEFTPKHGEILSFRFVMSSDAELRSDIFSGDRSKGSSTPDSPFTQLMLKTSGELYLKLYHPDQPGKDFNVAGIIEGPDLTLNGKPTIYAKGIEYPFTFQMDAKGYLTDFTFTHGVPEEAQLIIKTIFYAMQTVYPKKGSHTWKTREIDSTGQYQADYQLTDNGNMEKSFILHKKKQNYLLLHGANQPMAQGLTPSEIRIGESLIKTRVPLTGAWFISTEQKETSEMFSGNQSLGQTTLKFSAMRLNKQPAKAFSKKFSDVMNSLTSPSWIKEQYTVTDPGLNEVSANLDLEAAIKMYLAMRSSQTTADRLQAEKFMVNYLRLNPKACYDLIGLLDGDHQREQYDHKEQLELWHMITMAGHEDAQLAVLDAITNSDYSPLTHIRALAYIHSFEYPEPFLAESLWDFYHGIDMAAGDDQAKELGTMALYAIGGMGSDEKLNESLKPEIGKTLADNLERTENPETQVTTLQAIGNYGGSEVISRIDPYFSSEHEQVRVASYEALRRMESGEAFGTFVKYYSSESSQNVRTSALKILESMPATEETVTWAGKEVLKVDESDDQEALANVLGKNLKDYPQSEKAMRELLGKKPSNIVKKTVYRYIAP